MKHEQCRSKGIISGGGGTRAPEARAARGVKSRGLEMLCPAFSKSYL